MCDFEIALKRTNMTEYAVHLNVGLMYNLQNARYAIAVYNKPHSHYNGCIQLTGEVKIEEIIVIVQQLADCDSTVVTEVVL